MFVLRGAVWGVPRWRLASWALMASKFEELIDIDRDMTTPRRQPTTPAHLTP